MASNTVGRYGNALHTLTCLIEGSEHLAHLYLDQTQGRSPHSAGIKLMELVSQPEVGEAKTGIDLNGLYKLMTGPPQLMSENSMCGSGYEGLKSTSKSSGFANTVRQRWWVATITVLPGNSHVHLRKIFKHHIM